VSTDALWAKLSEAGLTRGDLPAATEVHPPWYVRLMLCIAGLIAAGFLIGFTTLAVKFVMDTPEAATAVGLMIVVGAYMLFRSIRHSDFLSMFALAVSFAGQGLFFVGMFGLFERADNGLPWVLIAVVEGVLCVVMPNFIHRVASAFAAGFALTTALLWSGAPSVSPGILATLVAWTWLNEARYAQRASIAVPAAYGLTLALVHAQVSTLNGRALRDYLGATPTAWLPPWMGDALVAAALVGTVAALVHRAGWGRDDRRALFAIAAAVALGAASFKAHGIAGGLTIVLLGFANGNRVLMGLGIAALVFYVSRYYYMLEMTLLEKSAALVLTGAVLLGVRWVVLRIVMPGEKRDA
jgi:hypothetical protein